MQHQNSKYLELDDHFIPVSSIKTDMNGPQTRIYPTKTLQNSNLPKSRPTEKSEPNLQEPGQRFRTEQNKSIHETNVKIEIPPKSECSE